MRDLLLVFVLSTASAQASVQFESPQAIIGGETAESTDAITQSTVLLQSRSGARCTGTVLANNVVLTASHCVKGETAVAVAFLSGTGERCEVALVSEVEFPEGALQLNEKMNLPDVALLRLHSPLCKVKAAGLPIRANLVGENVWAAGYGRGTESRKAPARMQLRWINKNAPEVVALYADLDSSIVEEQEAIDSIRKVAPVMNRFFDFAVPVRERESVCFGDSGGPTYVNGMGGITVVGVNGAFVAHPRKGTPACKNAYLQLLAPVFPHVEWIRTKLLEWR